MQINLLMLEATTPLLEPILAIKETRWIELVKEQVKKETLKGRTCKMYSKSMNETVSDDSKCMCGRYVRRHSYTGVPVEKPQDIHKWVLDCVTRVDVTVYGERKNGSRVCQCF